MNVIIIGCGKLGAELAYRLFLRGQKVVVVDRNAKAFNNLPNDFHGRMHEGDALDQEVLLRAGIECCDAFACVTNSDALNAVLGHAAKSKYKVQNIFVRNYDPQLNPLFEMFGLQTVCSAIWGAQRLEELIFHSNVKSIYSAGNGEIEIYEIPIPDQWHETILRELIPDEGCMAISITRAGKAFLPDHNTKIEAGDILLLSGTFEGIEKLRKKISSDQEAG